MVAELPRLRRYARALVRDADGADDLVQDCLERALSRLHQFRDGTDMRAWLFAIMHNVFVNGLRDRPATSLDPLDPLVENRLITPPAQGQALVIRDLEAALGQLPGDQREIVILIGLENMTYKQAAQIAGIPLGTVMSRLARARARLSQLMGEEDVVLRKSE